MARKAAAKATTKSPRKRGAVDDSDTSDRIHAVGDALLSGDIDDTQAPMSERPLVRDGPNDDDADRAAAEERGSRAADCVKRALRFADKEAFARLYPTHVECGGARGSVIVPWQMPTIPPEGIVVDARRLHRVLCAATDDMRLDVTGGGSLLEVRFGSRRFKLALETDHGLVNVIRPPEGVANAWIRPSVVRAAAVFAGPPTIEPPQFSGVHIAAGAALGCDRRGLIVAHNATDNTALTVTVPANSFDDLSVGPDGEERVVFGVSSSGHAVIADPRTGEWRTIVAWGAAYPDVRGVLHRMDATTHVDVDKASFVSALKQFRIVQSAGSSVKMNAWTTAAPEGAGQWLELTGGDNNRACEFVARLGVQITSAQPLTAGVDGMYRVCVALDELLKIANAAVGPTVRLGFGPDERSPIVVKNQVYDLAVMPMVA